MKIIYHYHPDTGLLLGAGYADPDPLDHGNWLIPAHATDIAPPAPQEGKNLHFIGGEWVYRDPPQAEPEEQPAEPEETEEPPPAPKTQFTSLEFLDRFTEEEQLTVVAATLQSPQVKLWYDRMLAASYVDLHDPRTEIGIDALIAFGLIAQERKADILAPEEPA